MNKAIISIITLILLIPIVIAIPTFHHFYGNVYDVNGTIIDDTVSIVAYINNESHGSINSINGVHGYQELFFVEDGSNGDIITFYTNGYVSRNYTFTNEEVTELNLTLNELNQQVLCSNNIIDLGEECDSTNIIDSCSSLGFTGGYLTCKSDCRLDSSACTTAGGAGGGGGGGGGGAGGGGGGIPRRISLDTKEEFFGEGYTAKQTQDDEAVFSVDNKEYIIDVAKLRSDSITLDVAGSSSVFNEKDKKEFDVNNDGYGDISISLKEIIGGRAEITYKRLFKPEEKMAPPKGPIITTKMKEGIEELAAPPKESMLKRVAEFFKNNKIIATIALSVIIALISFLGTYKLITTLKPKPKINVDKLKIYINKTLEQGYPEEKILEACIKVGWKKELIEKVIEEEKKRFGIDIK